VFHLILSIEKEKCSKKCNPSNVPSISFANWRHSNKELNEQCLGLFTFNLAMSSPKCIDKKFQLLIEYHYGVVTFGAICMTS
jgi:hypothetical protein